MTRKALVLLTMVFVVVAVGGGVILEGRDTGTVVWPRAEVKFYLDADLETRRGSIPGGIEMRIARASVS